MYTTNSFSPAVLRDSVELEAKGQASAQITTVTIMIRGQKDKKIDTLGASSQCVEFYINFDVFDNFDNFDNFRVNKSSGINFRYMR